MPPTYAYVEYKDSDRVIVATSLIKDFAAMTLEDISQNKVIYWRSTAQERFYTGNVVLLGRKYACILTEFVLASVWRDLVSK